MNKYTLLFLLALAAVLGAYGISQYQTISGDLVATCCPSSDPECGEDPDDSGGSGSDSMPTEIFG